MRVSSVKRLGQVPFPSFTGERVYMQHFTKTGGLPSNLARWQDTVDAMLGDIECAGPIYLMIDQAFVAAGVPNRRPGLHVDGRWCATAGAHRHSMDEQHYSTEDELASPQGIILASSHLGCRAFTGEYSGSPKDDGDCSHITTYGLDVVDLEPGYAWVGDSMRMLHESIPLSMAVSRTVVRLNVSGWDEDLLRAGEVFDRRTLPRCSTVEHLAFEDAIKSAT